MRGSGCVRTKRVPYYLGIDGGGTKTTCAVGDESRVLAVATAGPSNVVRVGQERARESLQNSVRQACAAAGITPDEVARTCIGGSGAGRVEIAESVRRVLAEIVPTPIDVVGDMQTALEAAFESSHGVVVNAGTGSFAYGRSRDGRTARAGGWGFAISDEGSAHWIGRQTVSAALRGADQQKNSDDREQFENSPLVSALMRAWGVHSLLDLARAANAVPPPDFSALFRAVASTDSAIASKVLESAGRELAQLAVVVIERLFPADDASPVRVAITGGVFRHAALVREVFYTELGRIEPRAEVNQNIVDSVEGALRLARRAAKVSA